MQAYGCLKFIPVSPGGASRENLSAAGCTKATAKLCVGQCRLLSQAALLCLMVSAGCTPQSSPWYTRRKSLGGGGEKKIQTNLKVEILVKNKNTCLPCLKIYDLIIDA